MQQTLKGALIGALIVAAGLAGAARAEDARDRQITVQGHAEIAAAPDMATVTLGVSEEAAEAGAAMAAVSAATARVLERMAALGVAGRDIQTSGLSLYAVHEPPREPGAEPRVSGFRATNLVTLRLREIDKVGEVLDAAVGDGANRLDGIGFGLRDASALRDEARRQAVADARDRAEVLSIAAGVSLGEVLSISETGGPGGPQPKMMEMAMQESRMPIAPGEVSVEAGVTVVFAIE